MHLRLTPPAMSGDFCWRGRWYRDERDDRTCRRAHPTSSHWRMALPGHLRLLAACRLSGLGAKAWPYGACRVVWTGRFADRAATSICELVPAPAQLVPDAFTRLAYPGPHLIGPAFVAHTRVPGRFADHFLGPADNAVELVLGFPRCTHGCSVSAAHRGETWRHGKLPAFRPRSSGDRARLS